MATPSLLIALSSGTEAWSKQTDRAGILSLRQPLHHDNEQKEEFICRYSFKATYPRRYEVRPIIHYHYKVSLITKTKISKTLFTSQVLFVECLKSSAGPSFVSSDRSAYSDDVLVYIQLAGGHFLSIHAFL